MVNYITLDKEIFPTIMKMLDLKNVKCSSCGKRLRKDNFGLIHKDFYSCNSLLCLTEAIEIIENSKGEKEG